MKREDGKPTVWKGTSTVDVRKAEKATNGERKIKREMGCI
jgi:hypothetical protein